MLTLVFILAIFFAMNMGGASFAAAFGGPIGANLIHRYYGRVLFLFFVTLGAVLFGDNVSTTLATDIISTEFLSVKSVVLIFFTAGLSMFIANVMHVPQSTSLVTVASIAGVGAFYNAVNVKTILFLIPFWIILPLASYILTYFATKIVYPPRKSNFWIYERFVNHKNKLKTFVIVTSCYNAFSVGSNNVANVVGPLVSDNADSLLKLLFVFAIVYGFGAFLFKGAIKTVSKRIVPLGLLTASIISVISGTLMILASHLGIPQSFVMLQMGAVFAVSSLKEGHAVTLANPMTRKTLYTWIINPIVTFILTYILSFLWLR
ncbi:MAG: sulfate permease [Candidatus Omnitrophota bacterium]|jgi:sulfate permease